MATPTWKSYGGTQNLPQNNSIFANDITCTNLHVKNTYEGTLSIDGRLDVSGIFSITGSFVAANASVNDLTVTNDISINGTTYANDDLEVSGNLIAKKPIYLGPPVSNQNSPFFTGISNTGTGNVGLNVISPLATLDILGGVGTTTTLNLKTAASENRNVIAQNGDGLGITSKTSNASSALQFYNNTTINNIINNTSTPNIPDAQIQYTASSRNITISTPNSTQVQSLLAVSDRAPPMNPIPQIYNETAIIYDVSNTQAYTNNYYSVSTGAIGDALTLVSNDASSITFLHTTTPSQKGAQIGGGAYPYDIMRSFGTWGFRNSENTYLPAQSIVFGNIQNSPIMCTTGINTYQPLVDSYAFNVNGPVHIANGSFMTTANLPFQVLSSSSYQYISPEKKTIILVGTPSAVTSPYTQKIAKSSDGGKTWNTQTLNDNLITISVPTFLNSISINASGTITQEYIVIGGQRNSVLTSTDESTWTKFTLPGEIGSLNPDILSVAATNDATQNFFVMCTTALPSGLYEDYTLWAVINSSTFTTFIHSNYLNFKLKVIYDAPNSQWFIYTLASTTSASPPNSVIAYIMNSSKAISFSYLKTTPTNAQYFDIHIVDINNVIAVGKTATGNPLIIQKLNAQLPPFSNNNPWYDISLNIQGTLRSISTLLNPDISGAYFGVAVGDAGLMMYSNNAISQNFPGAVWSILPASLLNISGNATALTGYNLVSVSFIDIQTLVVTAVPTVYNSGTQTQGKSLELYVYIPGLFNSTANRVLDICGNVMVSGTVTATSFPTASDYRIKRNPRLLDDAFTVDRLQPKTYFNEKTQKTEIGFLAHEVQEHYPFLVDGEKDDPDKLQTLNYQAIIGILVKEIQKLKSQINL
jgi:hypothetical protein